MSVPVVIMPKGRMVQMDLFEAAPGVMASAKLPRGILPPRQAIIKLVPQEGGMLRPELETHPGVINLKHWTEEKFGVSRGVIAVLVDAGFVDGEKPAPRTTLVVLESWFAHRQRVRENPWFWRDEENSRRYTLASDLYQRREGRAGRTGKGAKTAAGRAAAANRAEIDSGGGLPLGAIETGTEPESAPPCHGESQRRAEKAKTAKKANPGKSGPKITS